MSPGLSLTSSETAMPTSSASPAGKRGGLVARIASAAIDTPNTAASSHWWPTASAPRLAAAPRREVDPVGEVAHKRDRAEPEGVRDVARPAGGGVDPDERAD